MGRAPALLSRCRAVALGALLAAVVLYEAGAGRLPALSEAWDVAFVAVVLIPTTLAILWLALPTARARGVLPTGLAVGVLAIVLEIAGAGSAFNVAKVVTYGLLGFVFLELFQELSWVVLVAAVIPWIDAFSVWRGPTKVVVTQHPGLFDRISIAFRIPGEKGSANLGPPDILFFALFLATAQRFHLRVGWTWVATTALLGITLALTSAFDLGGLPALPAISLGFLLPNADLLWRRWRD
ncbi:MAG: hypothetical protein ABI927_06800 [Gaiellaceae bacterium]